LPFFFIPEACFHGSLYFLYSKMIHNSSKRGNGKYKTVDGGEKTGWAGLQKNGGKMMKKNPWNNISTAIKRF
jgi:hypothetical protein